MIKKIWNEIKNFFKHIPHYTHVPPAGTPIQRPKKKCNCDDGLFGLGIHL